MQYLSHAHQCSFPDIEKPNKRYSSPLFFSGIARERARKLLPARRRLSLRASRLHAGNNLCSPLLNLLALLSKKKRVNDLVPTFVTTHTFCASRDTQVPYGCCLLIQAYFCAVQNYAEKAELLLSKCSWYPKRKFGVTMHFSEIIKLQFGKKKTRHTLLCILLFFLE